MSLLHRIALFLNGLRLNFVSPVVLLFYRTVFLWAQENVLKLFFIVRLWISRDLETKWCSDLFIILVVRESTGFTCRQCRYWAAVGVHLVEHVSGVTREHVRLVAIRLVYVISRVDLKTWGASYKSFSSQEITILYLFLYNSSIFKPPYQTTWLFFFLNELSATEGLPVLKDNVSMSIFRILSLHHFF
jgi:hypothetical protein